MKLSISNRVRVSIIVLTLVAALAFLAAPAAALPDYALKTGEACSTCHVNIGGGGALTPKGQAFQAIPSHASDPAGAFSQLAAAPVASPTAAAPASSRTPIPVTTPSGVKAATPTAPASTSPTATRVVTPLAVPVATPTGVSETLPRSGDTPAVGIMGLVAIVLLAAGLGIKKLFV